MRAPSISLLSPPKARSHLNLGSLVNAVSSVNEDLGLDNRDKAGLLADAGIPRESVGGFVHGEAGGKVERGVDPDGGPATGSV